MQSLSSVGTPGASSSCVSASSGHAVCACPAVSREIIVMYRNVLKGKDLQNDGEGAGTG